MTVRQSVKHHLQCALLPYPCKEPTVWKSGWRAVPSQRALLPSGLARCGHRRFPALGRLTPNSRSLYCLFPSLKRTHAHRQRCRGTVCVGFHTCPIGPSGHMHTYTHQNMTSIQTIHRRRTPCRSSCTKPSPPFLHCRPSVSTDLLSPVSVLRVGRTRPATWRQTGTAHQRLYMSCFGSSPSAMRTTKRIQELFGRRLDTVSDVCQTLIRFLDNARPHGGTDVICAGYNNRTRTRVCTRLFNRSHVCVHSLWKPIGIACVSTDRTYLELYIYEKCAMSNCIGRLSGSPDARRYSQLLGCRYYTVHGSTLYLNLTIATLKCVLCAFQKSKSITPTCVRVLYADNLLTKLG